MIANVSSSASLPAAAPDSSQTAASGKTLVHTPFGDVLVDAQSKPDFHALFSSTPGTPSSTPATPSTTPATPAAPNSATPDPAAAASPSLESVFGSQPFLNSPGGTGPGGAKWNYNPVYFATQATAEKVASLVGGTVVQKNDILTSGPFQQSAPNELIQFADGRTVNAGLIANFFNHGYPQSYIDSLLKNVTDGEQA
jgi:hypothetical protein